MQYYRLHQEYGGIVRGRHRLAFRWQFAPPDGGPSPESVAVIHVKPATDETVGRFRDLLRAGFRDGESEAWRHTMTHSAGGAHDRRLVRIYFQLLDDPLVPLDDCSNIISELRKFATVGHGDASPEVQHALAAEAGDYLADGRPRCAAEVIDLMLSHWGPAGFADAVRERVDRMHPLVLAACAASIPNLIDETREKKLLVDLALLFPLPAPGAVERHIQGLNADSYQARENSKDFLLVHGAGWRRSAFHWSLRPLG